MKYEIFFTKRAFQEIEKLQKNSETKALNKVISLYEELKNHPRIGIGKPERLKHFTDEIWSRRITKQHRLVYKIEDHVVTVTILSVLGHYDDT